VQTREVVREVNGREEKRGKREVLRFIAELATNCGKILFLNFWIIH
jgi:hypothetical protein